MTIKTINTFAAAIRSTIAGGHFVLANGILNKNGGGVIMNAADAEYLLATYGDWEASISQEFKIGPHLALDIRRPTPPMTQAEYDRIFWELCERAERLEY